MIARAAIFATSLASTMLTLAPAWIEHSPRLIWNASASAPVGLYQMSPPDNLKLDDLVVVDPPEPLARFLSDRGYLPRGARLVKRVLALPGQIVCRQGLLITVDGVAIAPARERDRRGRPLPIWQGCRMIARKELFLMNWDVPDSLDGRYFGALPTSSVVGRAVPLLTFEEK